VPPSLGQPFVTGTVGTFAGLVPSIATTLTTADRFGGALVRWRFRRSGYRVDPGLYAVGSPDEQSPVLATANYKLTFDLVRGTLAGRDAWLLVLDTRGINVWCAAGKGTFGTDELVRRLAASQVASFVAHGTVVVPQLGATGVSAPLVRRRSGFRVAWGPVAAQDLPAFLDAGMRATPEMRRVRFPLRDRLVLVPVEFVGALGLAALIALGAALVGGVGPGWYSLARATTAPVALWGAAAALLAGTVVAPALLPWLPPRMFSAKGALAALPAAIALAWLSLAGASSPLSYAAAALFALAGASFAAMNFTGTSTYTSLHGVEHEMRVWVPWQMGGAALAALLWIAGGWL
jgi:hypothetical protein